MEMKSYFKIQLKQIGWKPSIQEVKYTWADWNEYIWLQFEWYASTGELDRWWDITLPNAFRNTLKGFMENAMMLLQHDDTKPIWNFTDVRIDWNGLYVKWLVKVDIDNVFQKLRTWVLKTMSIWYRVIDWTTEMIWWVEAFIIKQLELFEISLVSVPMCAGAQIKNLTNLSDDEFKSLYQIEKDDTYSLTKSLMDLKEKKVGTFKNSPLADENTAWDWTKAQQNVKDWASDSEWNIDFTKYKQAFAWYDENASDNLWSYKLGFKDIIDWELKTVWRWVSAAMGALLGARGWVDIPDNERQWVYDLLAKYYAQFDKEVPEFKSLDWEQAKDELINNENACKPKKEKSEYNKQTKQYQSLTVNQIMVWDMVRYIETETENYFMPECWCCGEDMEEEILWDMQEADVWEVIKIVTDKWAWTTIWILKYELTMEGFMPTNEVEMFEFEEVEMVKVSNSQIKSIATKLAKKQSEIKTWDIADKTLVSKVKDIKEDQKEKNIWEFEIQFKEYKENSFKEIKSLFNEEIKKFETKANEMADILIKALEELDKTNEKALEYIWKLENLPVTKSYRYMEQEVKPENAFSKMIKSIKQ